MKYSLSVNGQSKTVEAEPGTPLLWVLRDELNLTGTKFGCGVASCGACTVHVNGVAMRSCSVPIETIADASVTTIEGVDGPVAKAVQAAWLDKEVVQCGYCQSGQIMSAIQLLSSNTNPTDDEIDAAMAGNACRCATYVRIKSAIKQAAASLEA